MPFEVEKVRARSGGFDLIFTEPIDPDTAIDPRGYAVSQYNYRHHASYGSSTFDHRGEKDNETELPVSIIHVSDDGMGLSLEIDKLRAGFVTKVSAPAIRNAEGEALRQKTFFYTLNEIPGGGR